MPSGGTPNDFFATPEDFGGSDKGIRVEAEIVEGLRERLSISRDEAYKFVEDEFRVVVEQAYMEIGSPMLTVQNGWNVFSELKQKLRDIFTPGY